MIEQTMDAKLAELISLIRTGLRRDDDPTGEPIKWLLELQFTDAEKARFDELLRLP